MRLVSWSMAKSITQALVGVAAKQGKVDVDTPMGNPHWAANDKRAQIPWRTWLQMTDGMRYLEIEAKTIADSDASRKLFGPGRLDVANYCAGLPLIHEPGTHWNYNSCGIVLTADALTRAIVPNPESPQARRAAMLQWMHESLFDVIGMQAAAGIRRDRPVLRQRADLRLRARLREVRSAVPARRHVGWPARAAGRLGRLRTHGWHERERRHLRRGLVGDSGRKATGGRIRSRIDTGPQRDAFSAQGFEGQYTLVVPSKDLIIVRLGLTPEKDLRTGAIREWLGRVARAFPVAAQGTE